MFEVAGKREMLDYDIFVSFSCNSVCVHRGTISEGSFYDLWDKLGQEYTVFSVYARTNTSYKTA